jgi:hypothetical protein
MEAAIGSRIIGVQERTLVCIEESMDRPRVATGGERWRAETTASGAAVLAAVVAAAEVSTDVAASFGGETDSPVLLSSIESILRCFDTAFRRSKPEILREPIEPGEGRPLLRPDFT